MGRNEKKERNAFRDTSRGMIGRVSGFRSFHPRGLFRPVVRLTERAAETLLWYLGTIVKYAARFRGAGFSGAPGNLLCRKVGASSPRGITSGRRREIKFGLVASQTNASMAAPPEAKVRAVFPRYPRNRKFPWQSCSYNLVGLVADRRSIKLPGRA